VSHRVAAASRWSAGAELASKAAQPLVFVILAAFLAPEDFGVAMAAMAVVALGQTVLDAAFAKGLVREDSLTEKVSATAFWCTLALSFVLCGFLWVLLPFWSSVFDDPRVGIVVGVLALQLPVAGATAIPVAILQRALDFKSLFVVRMAGLAGTASASISLAAAGVGVFSLVLGLLAGALLQLLAAFWCSRYRPNLLFDKPNAVRLGAFGGWVSVSAVLGWFYVWADSLVLGTVLSIRDLGLYRTGNALVIALFNLVLGPMLPVFYSVLSRLKSDPHRVEEFLSASVRTIALVTLPVAGLLALFADDVAALVFGPSWRGVEGVIAVMGLTHGIAWLVGLNGEALRAMGRPQVETKLAALGVLVYLPAYLLAARQGLGVFLAVRFGLIFVMIPIMVVVAARVLPLSVSSYIRSVWRPACLAACSVSLAAAFSAILPSALPWPRLFVGCVAAAFLHTTLAWTFDRTHVRNWILPLLRR
jgi:PST family polysaccharide transporter